MGKYIEIDVNKQFLPKPKPAYFFPVYQENFHCFCDNNETFSCSDCYFYSEDHDMGATIPYCSHLHKVLDSKVPGCRYHFCNKHVRSMVEDVMEMEVQHRGKEI